MGSVSQTVHVFETKKLKHLSLFFFLFPPFIWSPTFAPIVTWLKKIVALLIKLGGGVGWGGSEWVWMWLFSRFVTELPTYNRVVHFCCWLEPSGQQGKCEQWLLMDSSSVNILPCSFCARVKGGSEYAMHLLQAKKLQQLNWPCTVLLRIMKVLVSSF